MQIIEAGKVAKQVVCDCGSTDFHVTIKLHEIRLHCKHCTNIITVKDTIHIARNNINDFSEAMRTPPRQRSYRVHDNEPPFRFDSRTGYSTDEDWD
jgi:hypothetical protein